MLLKRLSTLITATVLAAVCSAGFAFAATVEWSSLIDQEAQVFEDPYRDLSYEQLDDLVSIYRLSQQLETAPNDSSARGDLQQQLNEKRAVFHALGIDPDWLIEQRWAVAEKREAAARAVNPDMDGVTVTMEGFVIGAPPEPDGTFTAYLVPERGMCSHVPPPPPIQLIKLRFAENWAPRWVHEPARVTGRLSVSPTIRQVRVVDGPVEMDASFVMDTEVPVPLADAQQAPTGSEDWIERLRAHARAMPRPATTTTDE